MSLLRTASKLPSSVFSMACLRDLVFSEGWLPMAVLFGWDWKRSIVLSNFLKRSWRLVSEEDAM